MHRVFILLQLSLWVTSIYALALGTPESQREARSPDVDAPSKGFVTFKLVKKATTVSTLDVNHLMTFCLP